VEAEVEVEEVGRLGGIPFCGVGGGGGGGCGGWLGSVILGIGKDVEEKTM